MLLVRGPRSNFGFVEVVRSRRGLIWRFRDNEVTSFGNVSMINAAMVRPSGNVGAFELLIRITRGAPEVRNYSASGSQGNKQDYEVLAVHASQNAFQSSQQPALQAGEQGDE